MSKAACIAAIKQEATAGGITDKQAEDIFNRARQLIESRMRIKNINLEAASKEIAGELSLHATAQAKVAERQVLLNYKARRDLTRLIINVADNSKHTFDEILEWWFLGSEKNAALGLGGGVFNKVHMSQNLRMSQLHSALDAEKVLELANDKYNPDNVLAEISALNGGPARPGSTGDATAKKIAQVLVKALDDVNAELRLAGGFVEEKAGWAAPVTHNYDRIVRWAKDNKIKGDMDSIRDAWITTIMPLLDQHKTMQRNGPDLRGLLEDVFFNLKTDKHDYAQLKESLFPDRGPSVGSLAMREVREKVLHFRDTAAELEYARLFGDYGDNYLHAYATLISRRAKTAMIMRELGPSGLNNFRGVIEDLFKYANSLPRTERSAKLIDSLQKQLKSPATIAGRFDSIYKTATGAIDVPVNATIAKNAFALRTWAEMFSNGMLLAGSIPDIAIQVPQMMYSGAKMLDALGNRLRMLFSTTGTASTALRQLGLGTDAYIADHHGLMGTAFLSSEWIRNVRKIGFGVNLMNWWTQTGRAATAYTLSAEWGNAAANAFNALSETHKNMLRKYRISELEWNLIRGTRGKYTEGPMKGHDVLSYEMFHKITDAQLDLLLTQEGLKHTAPNRQRMRIMLRDKWSDFLSDRLAAAMSDPGGAEKYFFTGKGKAEAGTVYGEAYRAIWMYKSFMFATFRRQKDMYQNMGLVKGSSVALAQVAAMTVAGYVSQSIYNLVAGKEIPKLVKDDGTFNYPALYKAMLRSGAGGMYATILFGEYKGFGRGLLEGLAGPLYGKGIEMIDMFKETLPDGETETTGMWKARTARQIEGMLPGLNLFYIRPAYDHALGFYIKEMLSPGYMTRVERNARNKGEPYFTNPAAISRMPFEERMEELFNQPEKAIESFKE